MKTRVLILALSVGVACAGAATASSTCSAPADWLEALGYAIESAQTDEELDALLSAGQLAAEWQGQDYGDAAPAAIVDSGDPAGTPLPELAEADGPFAVEWQNQGDDEVTLTLIVDDGDEAEQPVYDRHRLALRQARIEQGERLAARGDARSLLGAALVTARTDGYNEPISAVAQDYLSRAQRAAPNQALTWIVARSVCGNVDTGTCDPAEALDRLLALEPDNAAFWIEKYAADPNQGTEALPQAFAASRYDDHHLEMTRLALDSHRGLRVGADAMPAVRDMYLSIASRSDSADADEELDDATLIRAIPLVEAMLSSAFPFGFDAHRAVRKACTAEPAHSDLRGNCIHLYRRMAEDSTHMLGQMIAYNNLDAFLDADSGVDIDFMRGRGRMQWLQASFTDYSMDASPTETLAFMERSMTIGELAAMTELFQRQGLPLDPPDGWDYATWQQSLRQRFSESAQND